MKAVRLSHPFRFSLLSLALAAGFAQAADDGAAEAASAPAAAAESGKATELQTVQVKAEAVQSTRRVTTKSVDESTSTDLKDVLFNEPSVSIGGGNGTSQWTTIRGMGQDQIDIKVDNTYTDTQIFHHNSRFLFDPALVKVTAVQKGTGSASAGIGATSGAIIARTVDAKDLLHEGQSVGFKVNAGIGSNRGWSRGGAVYGRWGGLDALLAGSWVTEKDYKPGKGYRNNDGGSKINNSGLGQRGILAKIGYDFNDDHRLVLSHRQEKTYGRRALREEFDFSQAWRTATSPRQLSAQDRAKGYRVVGGYVVDAFGNRVSNDANNSPRYRILTHDTTNLEYEGHNMGFIDTLRANVSHTVHKRAEPSWEGTPTNKLKSDAANIGFDSILFGKHTLKYGINWRHQKSYPSSHSNNTVNEKKTDTGLYVEGIWDFSPVTVTTGLRYDHFNATFSSGKKISGSKASPSFGVIYDVIPGLSLNASLNYASRSPRLSEVMLSGGRVYSADDNLKAERSRNAEIGVKYTWRDALQLEGSFFDQKIKDVQAVRNMRYYNGGTLKNRGYEFSAGYKWRGLTARAGLAYNKPKMNGSSIDSIVTAVPMGRTWTAGLSYTFENPALEIGWRGRFVQSSSYVISETSTRGGVSTTTNTPSKRPGYGVNDIYVNWKPLKGKDNLNVNFSVNNVFNKYYKPHSQRESGSGSSLPEVGRDVRLAVNYRW